MSETARTEARKGAPSSRRAYYAEAARWAAETTGALQASRRTAWRLAAVAGLVAALNGVALLALQPLRRSVAYRFTVESQRSTEAVRPLQAGVLQADPAFTQAMLARYVTAREEFRNSRVRSDFRLVELLSDASIRAEYAASMQKTSGQSPMSMYLPTAVAAVTITSISLLDANTGLVRFATLRTDLPAAQPEAAQATISFTYSRAGMRDADRFDNPLGFQVTRYLKAPL